MFQEFNVKQKKKQNHLITDANQVISQRFNYLGRFTKLNRFFINTNQDGLFSLDTDYTTGALFAVDRTIISSKSKVFLSSNIDTASTNTTGILESICEVLDFSVGNLKSVKSTLKPLEVAQSCPLCPWMAALLTLPVPTKFVSTYACQLIWWSEARGRLALVIRGLCPLKNPFVSLFCSHS